MITIILKHENGDTIEKEFDEISEAAGFCKEFPDYGISIFGNGDDESLYRELQRYLEQ